MQDVEANAVVFQKISSDIRDATLSQMTWAINKLGVESYFKVMTSPARIVYIPTGQLILFKGCDKAEKSKGLKVPKGYIKYLWFEELDQFNGMEEIRTIMQTVARGNDNIYTFYSYNPPKSQRSWVNQESKINKDKRLVLHTTYLQAPKEWLGEVFINNAEHLQLTNENACNHEYLGLETGTGTEIFQNITARKITDEEIASFDNIRQGIDWGYYPDPFVFLRMYLDTTRKKLYLIDEISGNRLSNSNAIAKIKAKNYNDFIITCDSAEPKSIQEFNSNGLKSIGAKKGAGSIEQGIKYLAEEINEIIIDIDRTPLAYREFINYSLERNKSGDVIERYPDKNNHTIDTVRYAVENDMNNNKLNWA
jgi:PBSX family phage terminase large subunit